MIVTLLLNTLSFFLGLLGSRGIYILSSFFGILWFDILRIRRKIALKNLDIAFANEKTDEEKIRIARKSAITFIRTVLEFFAAKRIFPKTKITLLNEEIPRKQLQKNAGLYAMCIHIGNWELLCGFSSKYFAPVHVVVKSIGKSGSTLAQWTEKVRVFIGYRIIDRQGKISATQQIFNALDKKDIIGFIVDQKRPRGEMLPFFGKNASTNNSLAKLWLRKKSPIVPVIIKRTGLNSHEIIFFPEFEMTDDKTLTFEENVTNNTIRMNLMVEKMIRQNPEEYFWFHNRWAL